MVFILYNIILSISLPSSLHSNTSCIYKFRCYQGVLKHKRILRVVHHLFCKCSKFTKVFTYIVKLMNISPFISKKCQWVTICSSKCTLKSQSISVTMQCGKYFFGWNIMLIIITFPAILLNFSVFLTVNIRNQIRRSQQIPYINFDLSGYGDLILILNNWFLSYSKKSI